MHIDQHIEKERLDLWVDEILVDGCASCSGEMWEDDRAETHHVVCQRHDAADNGRLSPTVQRSHLGGGWIILALLKSPADAVPESNGAVQGLGEFPPL